MVVVGVVTVVMVVIVNVLVITVILMGVVGRAVRMLAVGITTIRGGGGQGGHHCHQHCWWPTLVRVIVVDIHIDH